MKRNLFLTVFVVILLTGCKQKAQNVTIDLDAIQKEASSLIDKYQDAVFSKDLDALSSTMAEDGLYCGSDPTEIWTKQEMIGLWQVLFADSTYDTKFNVELRKIKVSKDGHSAIVMQHAKYPGFSPKLKVRQTYHMSTQANNWMFDYIDYAILFGNEDIVRVNEALEMK